MSDMPARPEDAEDLPEPENGIESDEVSPEEARAEEEAAKLGDFA